MQSPHKHEAQPSTKECLPVVDLSNSCLSHIYGRADPSWPMYTCCSLQYLVSNFIYSTSINRLQARTVLSGVCLSALSAFRPFCHGGCLSVISRWEQDRGHKTLCKQDVLSGDPHMHWSKGNLLNYPGPAADTHVPFSAWCSHGQNATAAQASTRFLCSHSEHSSEKDHAGSRLE